MWFHQFREIKFCGHNTIPRRRRVPNDPYSPRRGESAKQRARDRGGIGLLGTIGGNIGSRFILNS
jgi:hypothetical protein